MTKRLLILNGVAALMLGIHHATSYGFNAMFEWTDRYLPVAVPNYDQIGTLPYYLLIIIQQLDFFALPAFMFVSGFFATFLFVDNDKEGRWARIKPRIINLTIPFLLWSVLVFVLFLRRLPTDLEEVLFWYYYIPLVIQFYVLAPFLIPFAKKNWKAFLVLAVLLELGRFTLKYVARIGLDFPGFDFLMMITPRWLFPNLFSYFAVGLVASFHRDRLMDWLTRHRWQLLAVTIGLAVLTMVEYEVVSRAIGQRWLGSFFGGYSRLFYALAFVFCFLAFDKVEIPFSQQISALGGKSLGVYLVHSRLMYIAAVFLYDWTPEILGNQYLYLTILAVFAVGGSLLLMELVKITPARKYYKYIFG